MPDFTVNYAIGNTLYMIAERLSDGDSHTINLTDNADGTHTGNMPSSAGLGQYACRAYKQSGVSPDTDVDTLLTPNETRIWSGSEFDFDKAVDAALGTYKPGGMTFAGVRSG